jgi:Uma2 family endonuclease
MNHLERRKFSEAEYLWLERQSGSKSEFYQGEIFAMAGGSYAHNRLVGNIYGQLYAQLRGKSCEPHNSDMRLKIQATGLHTYPDVFITCNELEFADFKKDTLLNPTLIIEVLSSSTESYDHLSKFSEKFRQYRLIPTLKEYVLVSQWEYSLEHYVWQSPESPDSSAGWLLHSYTSPEQAITLPSIGCTLQLRDIYEKVDLEVK